MITLAQVSDIHVGSGDRNEARAQRLFAHLAGLPRPVDAVVITGDITDHGAPEEYEKVRALIETLPYPVFTCPGNHDERGAYANVLLGEQRGQAQPQQQQQQARGPINRVHSAAGAVFVLCDSTVPGEPGGYLAD